MAFSIKRLRPITLLSLLALGSAAVAAAEPRVNIDREYYRELLASDCLITPHSVVDLSAPTPGLLETVHVERSDYVEKGQLLASMAAGVEHANVALARKRALIQADIHVNRINLDYDKRQQGRIDTLFEKKAVNMQHKDEADRDTQLSAWKLQEARDIAEIRVLELKRAEEQLQQKQVYASIDGFIVKRYREGGEYVDDQPILRIARLDPLYIEAVLPLSLFGKVFPGMKAEIFPETMSDSAMEAEVTVVDRMGDAASGTFGLRLAMPNPEYTVPAGLKCKLRFLKQAQTAAVDKTPRTEQTTMPTAAVRESVERLAVEKKDVENKIAEKKVVEKKVAEHKATVQKPVAPLVQTLGPITDAKQLASIQTQLQALDLPAYTRQEPYTAVRGYLVVSAASGDIATLRRTKEQLSAAGVKDVALLGKRQTRRLAFGFFSDKQRAEKRRQALSSQGITSIIEAQNSRRQRWWLDTELPAGRTLPAALSQLVITSDKELHVVSR